MVKKITRYECDICGLTFPSESKAVDCESNHEDKRPVVNEKAEMPGEIKDEQ